MRLEDPRRSRLVSKWCGTVGPLSARSSRLVLALCAAFAAPLCQMAGLRPFLVHLYGPQAEGGDPEGRQLALRLPSCVYGQASLQTSSWGRLARHPASVHDETEDGLLLLSGFDEAPHGEVIDAACARWFDRPGASSKLDLRRDRVTLSCGSLPIDPALLRKANGPGKAWILNVPTDAGRGDGMFEIPATSFERMDLQVAADDCGGYVGLHWLAHLNREGRGIVDRWQAEEGYARGAVDPSTRMTIVEVSAAYSRLATAGEEATRAGLTGWPAGTAQAAIWQCFEAMFRADARRAGHRDVDAPGTLTINLLPPAEGQDDETDD